MDFLTHHILHSSATTFPEKIALVHGEDRLTYSQLVKNVVGLANGLQGLGVRRIDRVGVYLEPSVPQVLSIFGVSQAGGAFVPINPLLMPKQVEHIARDCGMKGLITSQAKLETLVSIVSQIPSLEFVVVVSDKVELDMPVRQAAFHQLVESASVNGLHDWGIEKDLAAIIYTSGSTGKPKGVMLSHANILAGSSIVSTYLGITEKDRILAVLPFSFDAGLNQPMTAFQQGGALVLMKFVFAKEIVQMLAKEEITGLAGVPTLWNLLAQANSGLGKVPLPSLRYITNTGGAMPLPVLSTLKKVLPQTKIFLMYGLTEAFRSTYLPPEELNRRPGSMGKAIPNTEILVINADGQPCRPGEVGELVHRGPTVSMGYWGRPDITDQVLRLHPCLPAQLGQNEKVCYSGDLVKSDEEGFLYFVGRRDNMIKSAGFRISRTEVEEVLYQSGWVQEAAVIGIPDPVLGQAVKAFVMLKESVTIEEDQLLLLCSEKLPKYMVPKSIDVVDHLPKTPNGKIDYPDLQSRAS